MANVQYVVAIEPRRALQTRRSPQRAAAAAHRMIALFWRRFALVDFESKVVATIIVVLSAPNCASAHMKARVVWIVCMRACKKQKQKIAVDF